MPLPMLSNTFHALAPIAALYMESTGAQELPYLSAPNSQAVAKDDCCTLASPCRFCFACCPGGFLRCVCSDDRGDQLASMHTSHQSGNSRSASKLKHDGRPTNLSCW